ncbi:DMT family transporter [Mycolicibacterium vaccae]|uniref:DMT family transporter n=1 Tax=Mycolicibacterium vaccae TaxID=1810 RepID=UPI003CE87B38
MAWLVLIVSAAFEAVWATALGQSEMFTRPVPTVVFVVASILSFVGLGWAARTIPIGTAYTVWTGLGAALTVGYAMSTGEESVSPAKLLFLLGIIGAVAGLRLLRSPAGEGTREFAHTR